MREPGESEDAGRIQRALENARTERDRLGDLGRWSEADEAVLVTLRDVLAAASHDIIGTDLGGLVYVAGSPRPGHARLKGNWGPVPPDRLHATCAMLLVNRGREPKTVVELAHRALESFAWRDLGTFWYAVLALAYADDIAAAGHHLERAMARSGWSGPHPHSSALTALRARVAALGGEPRRAWQLLDAALRQGVVEQFHEVAVAWAIAALVDLGDLDRAEDLLLEHGFANALDGVVDRAEVLAARGALREATGRAQPAYEDWTACGRELAGWGVTNPAVLPWRSQAALCAAAADRRSLALSLANEELFHAQRWGTPQAVGSALRAVALVSDEDRDVKLLKEAADHLARSNARGTLLRARYELGVKLSVRAGDEDGRPALRAARETAAAMNSEAWVHRIDAALRRWAGEDADAKLTAQELKVLNLARAGLANKAIAARLHLGTSTVEFHLSNGYRKLGISGRGELPSLMMPVW
ncbi:helix-turn-helix transcriptional regulator [Amycolatopsis sp. A133]|uniref:helix-turn-helix transcriptional regulator n=1 Tax=Amycolatopsis sp. A133 TaxID=3064472 RepID=UPI0027EAA439|nr:helix-turn-helix transcriptional regulator [Amycolatopsis sp. A133]MDQ7810866.1 helix-turn-helix transcriptional regulator [Amycolatopsis sp. A133]